VIGKGVSAREDDGGSCMNCKDADEDDSSCFCSEDNIIIGGLIGNVGEGVTLLLLSDVKLLSLGGRM
jgi:hypothetical protein